MIFYIAFLLFIAILGLDFLGLVLFRPQVPSHGVVAVRLRQLPFSWSRTPHVMDASSGAEKTAQLKTG